MKFPYILKKNSPHFFSADQKFYPYAVPSKELFPEFPWPKSLCEHAHECPVSDSLTDLENVYSCAFSAQYGCPLNLTAFDEFAELESVKDVEIFEIGQEATKNWTSNDLDEIVKNFEVAPNEPPMIALGHDDKQDLLFKAGLPAAGWVSKIRRLGNKLICDFKEMPKLVAEALRNKAYKYVSAEIYPSFIHQGKNIGKVLRRVALLGADIPRIKSLQEVMARYDENGLAAESQELKTVWTGVSNMDENEKKLQEMEAAAQAQAEKMAEAEARLAEFAEQLAAKDTEIAELKTSSPPGDGDPADPNALKAAEEAAQAQAEKMAETDTRLTEFSEQLKAKDAEIAELKASSEKIEQERDAEKRASHLRHIDSFCEDLKTSKGLSAAIIDEGSIKTFLTTLDHETPIKFSEDEEKSAFDKALEVFSLIADKAREGVLTVPLDKLKEPEDFGDAPKGVDADGFMKDRQIKEYAEKNKVSYEDAYQALFMGGN